ncbi:ATP-grasp domain-containing protein [Actinoalloteichus caeruleus]|uniref:ATP-grasp domain-containing protein n=1 Tax=Actinoalloteichus caeruleus DSM 43889 TaxID=1120930 RepID=A0ABT1JBW3_ACTCY|nr:hypothetical protein [Actinoalloteichus caeruleus DSM 43889]
MRRPGSSSGGRVVLVTCAELPGGDADDAELVTALGEVGVSARWAAWGFEATDDEVVVLRSPWDYTWRRAEFLEWCSSVPTLLNPVRAVRWNTDKRYLVELSHAGLPVVPTQLVAPGEPADWPGGEVVVKPSVGAGARGAGRFGPEERSAAQAWLAELHASGATAVVQPYQHEVDRRGEYALVFLGGQYSHAFAKPALLTGPAARDAGLSVDEQGLTPAAPTGRWRRVAEDCVDLAADLLGMSRSDLLYARVDLVGGDGGDPVLLELEVTEPTLGFGAADPAAVARFASAVRNRVR